MPEAITIDELRAEIERLESASADGLVTTREWCEAMGLDYDCASHAQKARIQIRKGIKQGTVEYVRGVVRKDYTGARNVTVPGFRLVRRGDGKEES